MEAIRSFKTSVRTKSTRRHIPEDGILHSHRRENLKNYILYLYIIFLRFNVFMAGSYKNSFCLTVIAFQVVTEGKHSEDVKRPSVQMHAQ
jgi:hypothetical protein